jgi:PAS domain S-box-containing protein
VSSSSGLTPAYRPWVRARHPLAKIHDLHNAAGFLKGDGETVSLIRAFDWASTALGPLEDWPQSLKTATALVLLSPVPIVMLWGEDGYMIYNDAYSVFAGARHPALLGTKVREGWPEVAAFNDHVMKVGLSGQTLSYKDQELVLHRSGAPEKVWMNLDYSPVLGDDGEPAGVIAIVVETTAGVQARRRLTAEREQFARLFDQAPTFMALLTGPEHRIALANPAYHKLIGHRPIIGKTVAEALPDAAAQGFLSLLDDVYRSGQAYSATGAKYAVQAEPGGPIAESYVDFVFQPIVDAHGAVSGIFVQGADVTAGMAGEASLRDNEDRNRQILDSAIDYAIIAIDRAGLVTRWNEGAHRIFGWSEADMLGRTLERVFTPEDVAVGRLHREMQTALQTGRGGDERWHIRRNGERFWALGEMTTLRGRDDAIVGFVKVLCDRTAQRMAEEARDRNEAALKELAETLEQRVEARTRELRDSKDFARLALSAIDGVGVWTHDIVQDRVVCDANIAALYDIDPEEGAAGVSPARFLQNIHPDDAAYVAANIARGLVNPGDQEMEYRIRHGDGSIRWVLSRGHTYFDEAGKAVRRTGVGVDMTKQRLLEEQFRQSQKMEAVGQLTGGLAHDFNNMLTGITGSLEMLQTRIAQGKIGAVDRYVAAAQGAARRAAALTHRLLAFSRRQTLDPKPTDVNRLISDMEELVRRTVGPLVEIEVVNASGLWPVLVDQNQLENALLNLCINARDAMPEGGRIVIATANLELDGAAAAERDLAPGSYISLSVSDTGAGMTPDVMARAFDPFFTTKPLGEGTGLGLSMIYGFVRQSGGQVAIDSAVGQGTTMRLYLPRDHSGSAIEASPRDVNQTAVRGDGEVVLVIDDEPTIRMLIGEALEAFDYVGIEAGDGPTGLRILQSQAKIDLLITDVGLPGGMNGRQVADAARVLRPDLKVLFITGFAETAIIGDGHLDPGMEILTKPFALDVLTSRIRRLVES